MAGKSEWAEAGKLSVQVVKPGTVINGERTKEYALVLRHPDTVAFVVQGNPRQLQDLGTQIGSMVRECTRGVSLGGEAGAGL